MVLLSNSRRVPLHFTAPDDGGGSGASDASGQSQGKTDTGGNGGTIIISPFVALPWDELDDETTSKLKDVEKSAIATLQENVKLKADLEKQTGLARSFQSEADRLKAEQDKQKQQQQQQQPDPYESALTEELKKAGYTDKDAAQLAPVFGNMFKRIGVIQKEEIGRDLAPMGNAVLVQQATVAFQTATQTDAVGIFQNPEIAEKVWKQVVERTKAGGETTPEFVSALGSIAWVEHIKEQRAAGKEISFPTAPSRATPTIPGMTMPQFSFPGNTVIPTAGPIRDVNAPKHVLDTETANALATTFKSMAGESGLYPKALKDIIQKRR